MYTTTSGQMAVFKQMEVIANNLANMTTVGFKAEKLMFEKALKEQAGVEGSLHKEIQEPSRLDTDEYVNIRGSFTDFSQGPIRNSQNPLDVAIQGDGMFVVQTPEGQRFTRSGEFTLDEQGRLSTHGGHAVQGTGGDIIITGGAPKVENDGTVSVNGNIVGQIRVVELSAGGSLVRESQQLFRLGDGSAVSDVANIQVQGGALEESNVNAVSELTSMIMASRMYEAMETTKESSSRMSRARQSVFDGSTT